MDDDEDVMGGESELMEDGEQVWNMKTVTVILMVKTIN